MAPSFLVLLLVEQEECEWIDGSVLVETPVAMRLQAVDLRVGELDSVVDGAVWLTTGVGC